MIAHYCIIIILLILAKALITAISTSLRVLNLKQARYIADVKPVVSQKLKKAIDNSKKHIYAASIVKAFLTILIGFFLYLLMREVLANCPISWGESLKTNVLLCLGIVVCFAIVVYLLAFIGSIVPKKLAHAAPDRIVLSFNWIIGLCCVVFLPVEVLIRLSNKIFDKIVGRQLEADSETVSEEEILMMIDVGEEKGSIDENEREMINNIFEFDDKPCGDVSTHRKEIVAIPVNATVDEIIEVVTNEKFTRIPVYEENIDNIVGILHSKDFMSHIVLNGKDNFKIRKLLMEPMFVPTSKKTDELFEEMRKNKTHLCVVVDEYGGTEGIVTLEDLIEEIMGNIFDEYDEVEEDEISVLDDNSLRIDGTTALDDVSNQLEIEMPLDEYETLSGFIIGELGRIPEENEEIEMNYKGYRFEVEKIEDKRIVSIRVIKCEEKATDSSDKVDEI